MDWFYNLSFTYCSLRYLLMSNNYTSEVDNVVFTIATDVTLHIHLSSVCYCKWNQREITVFLYTTDVLKHCCPNIIKSKKYEKELSWCANTMSINVWDICVSELLLSLHFTFQTDKLAVHSYYWYLHVQIRHWDYSLWCFLFTWFIQQPSRDLTDTLQFYLHLSPRIADRFTLP